MSPVKLKELKVQLQGLLDKGYIHRSKCKFCIKEVPFLGHVVSLEGITVDPSKVKEVLDWKPPTSVSKV
jgi:hypothetical protein